MEGRNRGLPGATPAPATRRWRRWRNGRWRSSLAVALPLGVIYITSVVAANFLTSRYGLIRVTPPPLPVLYATAGTPLIGGVLLTRDFLQDAAGREAVFLAILLGALLSFLTSSHAIAVASGVTFLVAETIEMGLYSLRSRWRWGTPPWAGALTLANATGDIADTLIFLFLAGFPLTLATVSGQLLCKFYVTLAAILIAFAARTARHVHLLHPRRVS